MVSKPYPIQSKANPSKKSNPIFITQQNLHAIQMAFLNENFYLDWNPTQLCWALIGSSTIHGYLSIFTPLLKKTLVLARFLIHFRTNTYHPFNERPQNMSSSLKWHEKTETYYFSMMIILIMSKYAMNKASVEWQKFQFFVFSFGAKNWILVLGKDGAWPS